MESRSKYLIKNTGILTISNFASKILSFLLVPLYTSILSTTDVGIYDIIASTVTLLYPILTMNIVDGVMRFSMDGNRSKDEIIGVAIRHIGISWAVGAAILCLLHSTGLVPQIVGYEMLAFLLFFFYVSHQLLVQFSKGLERVADMGIAGVIGTVAMLGGNVLFLLCFRIGLRGFFIANVLAEALPSVYLFLRIRFWKYIRSEAINKKLRREMLIYCVPLIATVLGWWVNSTSDRYVVTVMCGVAANGLLSVAYKIPSIISTLQGIFIQAWQISAIKEYGRNDTRDFYGRAFIVINTLMCAACAWLIILTKPLAYILYQKDFFNAWKYVPFLIISCVLNSASGFMGPILSAKKASKPMAMSAVYGAGANLVMNILFVYAIGIQGATIATVISSFIIYAFRKRAVGDDIKIERYGFVLITWLLLCVQAVLEIYTGFWWLEIVLMVIMLGLNWRNLIQLVSMGRTLFLSSRSECTPNSTTEE